MSRYQNKKDLLMVIGIVCLVIAYFFYKQMKENEVEKKIVGPDKIVMPTVPAGQK